MYLLMKLKDGSYGCGYFYQQEDTYALKNYKNRVRLEILKEDIEELDENNAKVYVSYPETKEGVIDDFLDFWTLEHIEPIKEEFSSFDEISEFNFPIEVPVICKIN